MGNSGEEPNGIVRSSVEESGRGWGQWGDLWGIVRSCGEESGRGCGLWGDLWGGALKGRAINGAFSNPYGALSFVI